MNIGLPLLNKLSILDIIDIVFVAFFFYYLLNSIKGTRAVQILQGVGTILLLTGISYILKLETIYWILHYVLISILVALPIVFQPELRRTLGLIGRGGQLFAKDEKLGKEEISKLVVELTWACNILSQTKTGAIIVIENQTGLEEYIETGVLLNSDVSAKLLLSIFVPASPLHDGAIIIRQNKIVAASCYLPLSDNIKPSKNIKIGSRHLAALGLSEQADAIIIIVSEENGIISISRDGKLKRGFDEVELKNYLNTVFMEQQDKDVHSKILPIFGGKQKIEIFKKKPSP